jgi:hypothetical protein
MITATEAKRIYLQKTFAEIFNRIICDITTAIDSGERSVDINFNHSAWNSFNYSDVEWFLNSYGYSCSYDCSYVNLDVTSYIIKIDWYLE